MTKEQWQAIEQNDASYDGVFYYGIRTTGIVCRPSCPAKACLPQNVVIFDSLKEARAAGYRPCRRCRPELKDWHGPKAELAQRARTMIEENYTAKFSLEELAKKLFVSESYLLRTFREIYGLTPLRFHNEVRCERAKTLLQRNEMSVTEIAFFVGYTTPSHFTNVFRKLNGISPTQYRDLHQQEK